MRRNRIFSAHYGIDADHGAGGRIERNVIKACRYAGIEVGDVSPLLSIAGNKVLSTHGRGISLCTFCPKDFALGPENEAKDNAQGDIVDSRPDKPALLLD